MLSKGPVSAPARQGQNELKGLYYFRARYYDPYAGRFLQRDPVWDAGNLGNQYSFVGNCPVNRRDPFGLQGEPDWWNTPGGFNQGKEPWLSPPKGGEDAPAMSFQESAVPITAVFGETVVGYVVGLAGGKILGGIWKGGKWIWGRVFPKPVPPVPVKPPVGGAPKPAPAPCPNLSKVEKEVLEEVQKMLKSPEFAKVRDALKAGKEAEVVIGGRPIVVAPEAPFSGMTLFSEGGFVLGRGAAASEAELAKTLLHETFRLRTSQLAAGTGQAGVSAETNAAWEFAERAFGALAP